MSSSAITIGDRLERWACWLDRRPVLIVGILAAIYLALIAPAVHQHLSYDELHTFYIAQAPNVQQFIEEVRLLDLQPPLTYVLVHASIRLLGANELGTRLPIIVAFFLGSLALFAFASRRVGPLWGAAAVGLFWTNDLFFLATDARPYGILLAFLGLTLVSWDCVRGVGRARRWALAGVAAGATGMLLSHTLAVLWIAPFWVAELVWSCRQSRIDYALWGTLMLPLTVCVMYLPLIQNAGHVVFPSQFQGSVSLTLAFYVLIFLRVWPALIVATFAALVVAIWRRNAVPMESGAQNATATGFQEHDLVFLLASLLPPVLLNVVSVFKHIPFTGRYGIVSVLTTNLLVMLAIAYKSRRNRLSGLVAAVVILGFALIPSALAFVRNTNPRPVVSKDYDRIHPELPLVANSAFTFLEMDHYEKLSLLARLYYLVDAEFSIKYSQSNLTEGLLIMKKYFPIRANVSSYEHFAAMHRHFLIWGEKGAQPGWLLTKLAAEGESVTEIGVFDSPYPDSRLYEVNLKP